MKIGLVCPYNLFKGGGVQEGVFALQAELASRGHDVVIVTPQPHKYAGQTNQAVRLLGRSRDIKSPFHTTAQISVSVDPKTVDELLTVEQFDVLHFHEPWVPLLSWQLLQRSRAKNVATFHAKLPDTFMSKTIERVITPYTKSILKYLHGLTAVSEPAATYIRSLTDRPITIIPNGIDLKKYRRPAVKPAAQTESILYIGRLERRKGLKYLLDAMHTLQIRHPHVQLMIAGAGPDRWKLESQAKELGIHVTFLGRVSDTQKLELLHSARIFCSPACYGESFGIVLLEAMACGLPVVAGDNPGYRTVMQDNGRLSLVDTTDQLALVEKLDLLLHDESMRRRWSAWARQAVTQYDYVNIVDEYEALYKTL